MYQIYESLSSVLIVCYGFAGLPAGWRYVTTASGLKYYINETECVAQLGFPAGLVPEVNFRPNIFPN